MSKITNRWIGCAEHGSIALVRMPAEMSEGEYLRALVHRRRAGDRSAQRQCRRLWKALCGRRGCECGMDELLPVPRASASPLRTRFHHRWNEVTVWNIYVQQWDRRRAEDVSPTLLATLPEEERARIQRWARRAHLFPHSF